MGLYNRFCKRFFAAVIVRTTAQADSRALMLYGYTILRATILIYNIGTLSVCCVARRDFDLIEVEKPPAFRPLSRTRLKFSIFFGPSYTFVLCRRLRHVVCREGLLSSTSDSTVNLANGGFACDTSLPHYWRMLVIFCVSPCDSISSSGSVIGNRALCAGSMAGQHCCSSRGLLC